MTQRTFLLGAADGGVADTLHAPQRPVLAELPHLQLERRRSQRGSQALAHVGITEDGGFP